MHRCAGVFIFCCQNLNLPQNERMPTNQMTPVLDDIARGRNSLEQGGAGIYTIAISSSNYTKDILNFFFIWK